ncbi:MAG TPA: patatin-like phospholipase family protein [Cyclobacteriaceae bacterium]|nr:patatin-like phospholipase family protein [Cyclobacteriaceae bacterium]HRJ83009.1 patatin-like phospholipase family protein [Cyclobacteriaceae bacterium]
MNAYLNALQQTDIHDRLHRLEGRRFSDVTDHNGFQYVDLVQEGGGVLGIALVGYTYVLEQARIRFFSLAGTSAGAINTLLLASLGKISDAKSERILELLANQNLFEFVDGNASVRKLVQQFIRNAPFKVVTLALNALKLLRILKTKLGLNPGNLFEQWLTEALRQAGVTTLDDLEARRRKLPAGLTHRGGEDLSQAIAKLAIITSDITTHTKVEFPRMASLYWANPGKVSPALLVRASMSIPFFFEPYQVHNIPNQPEQTKRWDEYARYTGPIPPSVKFVDGGMLSNFPINVFHRTDGKLPTRPTFGVRLSAYRDNYSKVNNLFSFSGAMISTMRQIHDYDFLMKNPEYRKLICRIDADQEFNWLNFEMSENEKVNLFVLGAQKAIKFLEDFDWEDYKKVRAES